MATRNYPIKWLVRLNWTRLAPTGSIRINNGASYTRSNSVTLTLTATDAASGVFQVRFSNDGVWDTEQWETPASTKSWLLTSGDGSKTVYCQIKDNVGLILMQQFDNARNKTRCERWSKPNSNLGSLVTFDASGCTDNVGIISYSWDFGDGTTGTGKTTTHTIQI